jgi:hypothetical protein
MMSDKRTCKGTNSQGKPCKAAPLTDSDYCLAHADEKTRVSTGFGAPGNGRPRKPRAVDVLRERIEANIDRVLDPLWDALTADRAMVVGNGPTAHVELASDHPTRIAAARELLDRAYGRTRQSSEVTVITEDMIDQAIRRMEAELAELEHAPR